jgi:membrane protease subunit HflC
MRSPVTGIMVLLFLLLLIIVGYGMVFTVQQTEQALVVRFGAPVQVVTDAGLHFKAPFIDTVIPIDKRILDLENPAQELMPSPATASRTRCNSIRASARFRPPTSSSPRC